jgi:hypothetical protein
VGGGDKDKDDDDDDGGGSCGSNEIREGSII